MNAIDAGTTETAKSRNDHYDYPKELYCPRCGEDVDAIIEERTEILVRDGEIISAPYKAAVCPVCRSLLCERDRSYAVIRRAMMERNGRKE